MAVEVENGLSKVEVGDPVRAVIGGQVFDYITAESCRTNGGHWRCVTHDEAFANNMAKDSHLRDDGQAHTLAWHCIEHGIETP